MTDTEKAPEKATQAKTHAVGDTVKVRPSGVVIRPDGSSHVVIRGTFYLDQVGTFLVDGNEVKVK